MTKQNYYLVLFLLDLNNVKNTKFLLLLKRFHDSNQFLTLDLGLMRFSVYCCFKNFVWLFCGLVFSNLMQGGFTIQVFFSGENISIHLAINQINHTLHSLDLYFISEKSIWKNQVRWTGYLVYFDLNFYCLCSLQ